MINFSLFISSMYISIKELEKYNNLLQWVIGWYSKLCFLFVKCSHVYAQ